MKWHASITIRWCEYLSNGSVLWFRFFMLPFRSLVFSAIVYDGEENRNGKIESELNAIEPVQLRTFLNSIVMGFFFSPNVSLSNSPSTCSAKCQMIIRIKYETSQNNDGTLIIIKVTTRRIFSLIKAVEIHFLFVVCCFFFLFMKCIIMYFMWNICC